MHSISSAVLSHMLKNMRDTHNYRIFAAEQPIFERDCSILLPTTSVCHDTSVLWPLNSGFVLIVS